MKRIVVLITLFVFAVALAGMVYAQADTRSPAEKLAAGRAYLKLLDQKIIRHRKMGNTATVVNLQAQKKSTITRMQAWKAQAEGTRMAPPPPPPRPVAPPPPPRPVARPAAAPEGLLGIGLDTGYTLGYIAGKSVIVLRGDMIFADPMGIGPMLGLTEDAVGWKIGLGGAMGKDINDVEKKAIPLFVDGIINIPADVMGGVESYVGGGLNYVVYGSDKKGGSYGGQVYYGIQGDIGLGGDSYAELAYSIIRSGPDSVDVPYSMKGIGISVGSKLVL